MPPPPPPELTDDLVGEAVLRIPPDDPACLLRASLVCKRWRHILADPAFRCRHCALHRSPAVLGFMSTDTLSRFVPIDPASRRPAARDLPREWLVIDCRHGRALFLTHAEGSPAFVVWDPLTNQQHRLPRSSTPPLGCVRYNAAVLCAAAAEGCDHRDCHGGPFRVVFIFSRRRRIRGEWDQWVTSAHEYSSESGVWSELTAAHHPEVYVDGKPCPTTLVGDALYFRGYRRCAFEYQLATRRLSVIDGPPQSIYEGTSILLMSTEDGKLGFASVEKKPCLRLCLWSRETSPDGVKQWARGRAIELQTLLPDGALPPPRLASDRRQSIAEVVGFAEGTDVFFVGTTTHDGAVYMVQLNSGRVRKVFDICNYVFPFTSFCISVTDAASTGKEPGEGVSIA